MKTAIAKRRTTRMILCFFWLSLLLAQKSGAQGSNAIYLNGTDAYANLGTISPSGNFSTGLTIECWIKWGAFNSWSRLLDLGNGSASNNILLANSGTTANLRYEVYRNASMQGITSPVAMVTGRWYHVAVTQAGTGATTLYIDGNSFASGTVQLPADISRSLCYIGRSNWSADAYLKGTVDEMRIWNVVRTPSQIKQYMLQPVAANTSGLVAYYRCNEGSGTVLSNTCTNGAATNAATAGGLTWTSSPVQFSANALSLDGANDYVSIGAPLAEGSSYTKEAWVYFNGALTPSNIVSSYNSPWWIDHGKLMAGNNGPAFEVSDPAPFPANTWVHVAVSYDALSGMLSLYRNGNLVSSAASEFSFVAGNNYIGAWYNGTATESYFGGKIDEVRIWNVARTLTEIQSDMNTELNPATETNLVAYYTFNQGVAAGDNSGMITVLDQKGTNNGALTNLALTAGSSNLVQQQSSLTVLPVRFVSFTARKEGSRVRLQWSTATEQDALDFIVQHSTNGQTWTTLQVTAAAGNSRSTRAYSYVHASPVTGPNYYRIQQRDADGKSSFTPVRTVFLQETTKAFAVQNTVVTSGVLHVQVNQKTGLSLLAPDGRVVWIKEVEAGLHTIETGSFARGVYFLNGAGTTEKIILQ